MNELLHCYMYLIFQFRSKTAHSCLSDTNAQSLIVWSDERTYSTVLLPKCISSITYEDIKQPFQVLQALASPSLSWIMKNVKT